jgi:hypothetical protein
MYVSLVMPLPLSTWLNFPLDTAVVIFPTLGSFFGCWGTESLHYLHYLLVTGEKLSAAIKSGMGAFDKRGITLGDKQKSLECREGIDSTRTDG